MHNDEQHYVAEKDGVEMPSTKFKRLVLETMKSAAGDKKGEKLLKTPGKKMWHGTRGGSACRVGHSLKRPCIQGGGLGVAIVQHGGVL